MDLRNVYELTDIGWIQRESSLGNLDMSQIDSSGGKDWITYLFGPCIHHLLDVGTINVHKTV